MKVCTGGRGLLEGLYDRADRLHLGPLRGADVLHAALLNICLCLPYIVFDRYHFGIAFVVQRLLGAADAALPDFTHSINLSRLYPLGHIAFLVSLFVPHSRVPVILVVGMAVLGTVGRLFDPVSAVVLLAFGSVIYMILKAPWGSRAWKLAVILAVYVLFMNACQFLGKLPHFRGWSEEHVPELVSASRFGPGFIPMLWYVCYDVCAGRLTYWPCVTYLFCRFLSAPVFPPKDLRLEWQERLWWQWRGIFALATAFVGLSLSWIIERYLEAQVPTWDSQSGPRLLWYAYCYYLSLCFGLVARFNMFIGWARLFGIPVKNAFYFWLLARTPNERWQRWNILFREWIITYVFYPLMRAKTGLFISIMATLLMSGVLHFVGYLTPERFQLTTAVRTMLYWGFNGLAIYVVIAIPRRFPGLMDRLRIRESVLWSLVGIASTAVYYSVLFVLRDRCATVTDAAALLRRLASWG
jgi:hypothetical protein